MLELQEEAGEAERPESWLAKSGVDGKGFSRSGGTWRIVVAAGISGCGAQRRYQGRVRPDALSSFEKRDGAEVRVLGHKGV